MDFAHLHTHSFYSLMDGLNSPKELCETARSLGQTALAITDHGTLSAHREFQAAAAEVGIKPILGLEAYISPTDRFDRRQVSSREDNTQLYHHIILLAKNQAGYVNLQELSRLAWTEGYYYKPRIDFELLDEYGDDIIVLSGCLNGLIAKALENDDYEKAAEWAERLHSRFGDDFYIELQPHNPANVNSGLVGIADRYQIRTVATSDCHFSRPEERAVEEALLVLSTNPKWDKELDYNSTKDIDDVVERIDALYPERPISFADLDVYMMSRAEIEKAMSEAGYDDPDMFDASLEIADKVGEYEYYEDLDLLPRTVDDPAEELKNKVTEGLKARGLFDNHDYVKRARAEIKVINKKNFAPYFLVVEDMVRAAKEQGIRVGPGRGSAGSSLVCYALGITNFDPLEHNLLFARFINEERNDYPDIDIDFEDRHRDWVKGYLREKYGHAASITNFMYFSEKGVIRDAARVFRVPLGEVNKVLKGVDTFDEFKNFESTLDFREKYPEVLWLAEQLRGRIRQVGIHAGGMVVSKEPIEHYAPIETRDDPKNKVEGRIPVVAWDMNQCEQAGLIKLDVLGLSDLSVIEDTVRFIEDRHGIDLGDLSDIPYDDPKVFELLSQGQTVGVFQANAGPYTSLLRKMTVDSFDDIVASNALVRPGAANTVGPVFIDRKHGKEDITYVDDQLKDYLEDTYGTIVYQEQVMLASVLLGGFSWSEADKLRKIIGKKRDVSEFDAYRDKFVSNAGEKIGVPQAERLWADFEEHAGYSFNKSHAVGYSLSTYQTAWLKVHYPLEFITACLINEDNKEKRMDLLIEAKRLGIPVKLPHVNKSQDTFSIDDDAILIGLKDIKYVGDAVYAKLNKHRPFNSYKELEDTSKAKYSGISKRTLDALNKVGAATFKDNPKRGAESDYYFEYLNIPKFDYYEFPDRVYDILDSIEEFDDTGTFVYKAFVRGIPKRGKGWCLVEIMDETGSTSVFHDEQTDIEPGQLYFLLVSSNRIMKYALAEDVYDAIESGSKDSFVIYLLAKTFKLPENRGHFIVALQERFTKRRQMMANMVVSNEQKELQHVLVFPKQFGQLYSKIKEGARRELRVNSLDDGALMLYGVEKL